MRRGRGTISERSTDFIGNLIDSYLFTPRLLRFSNSNHLLQSRQYATVEPVPDGHDDAVRGAAAPSQEYSAFARPCDNGGAGDDAAGATGEIFHIRRHRLFANEVHLVPKE